MRRAAWSRGHQGPVELRDRRTRSPGVADGTVVSSRNDLPEQVPGALPQGMTIDQADGNFVVLDIGGSDDVPDADVHPAA